MSRARRCARISFWIPLEFRTDIAYRVFSGFARFGPLDGPEVIILTVRSCDRERSDRPIWTKLAGRVS
ncbi:unnamed protein product [Prunus armeniaca]